MPNTQTSVPLYAQGEVLTAANLNLTNSGIPVFATTVTRDAAFGGANEKVLAEGQFAYIEATNTTQYYDGAAWQSVGVSPGLVLISTTTIGTTVSSVTVTGAFSSTYDNYKIIVIGGTSSVQESLLLSLGATVTGYYQGIVGAIFSSAAVDLGSRNNAASWNIGATNTNGMGANFELMGANLAKNTFIFGMRVVNGTANAGGVHGGFLNNTTQYTDFTLSTGSGTLTGGTIKVYGYANSQDYMTYKIQIDGLVRNATADEAAIIDAQRAEAAAQAEAQAAKIAARQAVLDKLGLTADEAQTLFGQFGVTYRADCLRKYTRQHTYS